MMRLSKLTDYGVILMACFAREPDGAIRTSRDLAQLARLSPPTVSKVLKILARGGLLASHRGVKGGYRLARPPAAIAVAEVIAALEGRIALADCTDKPSGWCDLEELCPLRGCWQQINDAVRVALENLSLAELARPLDLRAGRVGGLRLPPLDLKART